MGVKGLTFFVENECYDVCRRVSIPEMASRWSAIKKPVIVVDGMSLINMMSNQSNWVYGGQWKELVERMKSFVDKFQQFGIEPVFFYDGSVCKSKRVEWLARRRRRLTDTDEIYYYIKSTNQHPPESMFFLPTGMASLSRFILKYECNCEIRISIGEADQVIADYARDNPDCFAILSQDSDFIIYDTKPYLSIGKLDMNTLTTVMFDRDNLARHIGLDRSLFPLLSCLLGNDVIQVDNIRPFHRSLCRLHNRNPSISELMPNAVRLIHMNGWTGQEIQHIASVMKINVESLIQALTVYSPAVNTHGGTSYDSTDSLHLARDMVINGEDSYVYTLLCRQEYESSELLENRSDHLIKPSALIYREIRRRVYKVVFGSKSVTVKEWCAYHGNPMERPEYITPGELDYQGPPLTLEILWSDQESLYEWQWELFRSCFGISIPPVELRKVPAQLVALCCILNFLMLRPDSTGLEAWEAVAFICQAISPCARNVEEIRRVNVMGVDARAVQLATVFMRGVNHFHMVAKVCIKFFPKYYQLPWHFFDGKLFHHYYLMAKRGAPLEQLCENQERTFRQLYSLYGVIRIGTLFPRTLSRECLPN